MEDWTVPQVCQWLDSIGLGVWEKTFTENRITGDLLIHADHEMLKELDMPIGPRLALLKAIYLIKLQEGIKVEDDDYVPETGRKGESEGVLSPVGSDCPSIHFGRPGLDNMEAQRLENMILERDMVIERLITEQRNINAELAKIREDLKPVWALVEEYRNFQQSQKASKHSHHNHGASSQEQRPEVPRKTPREEVLSPSRQANNIPKQHYSASFVSPISVQAPSNAFSTVKGKASPIKTSSKGIASLQKGSAVSKSAEDLVGSTIHTTSLTNLSPLSPVKMLDSDWGAIRVYGHRLPNRENVSYKSFKVNIHDNCMKIIPEVLKKYKIEDTWHHYALFVQFKDKERCLSFDEKPLQIVLSLKDGENMPEFVIKHLKQVNSPGIRSNTSSILVEPGKPSTHSSLSRDVHKKDSSAISDTDTAVAIYEYRAQRPDELNVVIGDKFHIIARETGWYVVEKDDVQGWVPSGCLLERNDPVEDVDVANGKILKGTVLYDYVKNSPNELTVEKGGQVLIHKQFQHWMLVDYGDQNGWVPSCYVSVDSPGGTATKSTHSPSSSKPETLQISIDPAGRKSAEPRSRSATAGSGEKIPNLSNQISMPVLKSQVSPVVSPSTKLPSLEDNISGPSRRSSSHSRSASLTGRLERGAIANVAPNMGPILNDNNALSKLSNLLDSINPLLNDSNSSSVATSSRPSLNNLDSSAQKSRVYSVLETLAADVEFWSNELKAENAQAKTSVDQLSVSADLLTRITKSVDGELPSPGLLQGLEQLMDEQQIQISRIEKLKQAEPTLLTQTKQERVDLIMSSIYDVCTRLQKLHDSVTSHRSPNDALSESLAMAQDQHTRELASDYKAFSAALGIWIRPSQVETLHSASSEPSQDFSDSNANPLPPSNGSSSSSPPIMIGGPPISRTHSSPALPSVPGGTSASATTVSSNGTPPFSDNGSARSNDIQAQLQQKVWSISSARKGGPAGSESNSK